jgi:uncharacterized protein (UPF0332 family)
MDFRDFMALAITLAAGSTEAEWRSAVSRAYYATFHVGCDLLSDLGFAVPRGEQAHAYLWLRLANSGHRDVRNAGLDTKQLRQERNRADYDGHRRMGRATADKDVQTAKEILRVLDTAALEPARTQITDAMKMYERDVLQEVTWHP